MKQSGQKVSGWAEQLLHKLVIIEEREVSPLLLGGASYFFCRSQCLASFFVLQPLRDDSAVIIGTHSLPILFLVALLVTIYVSPMASTFIVNASDCRRGRAIRSVYRYMALVTGGFYLLFMLLEYVQHEHELQRRFWHRTLLELEARQESFGADSVHNRPIYDTIPPGTAGLQDASTLKALSRGLQFGTRAAFYIWVTLQNVLATSTLWSRLSEVFNPDAGARLYGLIGAGATLGQLFGSVFAGSWASMVGSLGYGPHITSTMTNQLLLVAALFIELAGWWASRLTPRATKEEVVPHLSPDAAKKDKYPRESGLFSALQLIWKSRYLCHLCFYLFTNSFVSSMFYFTKTLVVAQSKMKSSSARTAWFANINSASAFIILLLQLAATGRIMHHLGIALSLSFTPLIGGFLMVAVALHPVPAAVALADILRRLSTYAVSRPAREVLFTVVTREEKYKAKAIIDTVILRIGDTTAAAVFSCIEGRLEMGPSMVAAVAAGISFMWAITAFNLGVSQMKLAAAQNRPADMASSPTASSVI